jgi:hypothetical protein
MSMRFWNGGWLLFDSLINCWWPSPAQFFLVPSPTGIVSDDPRSLQTLWLLTNWLLNFCWSSTAQYSAVRY